MAHVHGAKAVKATTGVAIVTGKHTLKKVLTHPVTLVGFGFALGYLVYKFRHDIITQEPTE